jgi:hypothetical protein
MRPPLSGRVLQVDAAVAAAQLTTISSPLLHIAGAHGTSLSVTNQVFFLTTQLNVLCFNQIGQRDIPVQACIKLTSPPYILKHHT